MSLLSRLTGIDIDLLGGRGGSTAAPTATGPTGVNKVLVEQYGYSFDPATNTVVSPTGYTYNPSTEVITGPTGNVVSGGSTGGSTGNAVSTSSTNNEISNAQTTGTSAGLMQPDLSEITTGQQGLSTGQQGLATGQQGLAAGQDTLTSGQANIRRNQDFLQQGQTDLGNRIGQQATTVDFTNPVTGQTLNPVTQDAINVQQFIAGVASPTEADVAQYDINRDGAITQADSDLIYGQIAGTNPQSQEATGLYGQFADQNRMLTDRFDTAISDIGTANTALTGLGTNVDALGTNVDTLGSNLGTLQGDVTRGFSDTAQGFVDQGRRFDNLDTSVGGVQSAVDTGFTNQQTNFDNRTDALNEAFGALDTSTAADARRDAIQESITAATGPEGLGGTLSDLSNTVGTVQSNLTDNTAAILENQGIMTDNQGNFKTDFDSYIERYGDDVRRADQSRADQQTGLGNVLSAVNENATGVLDAISSGTDAIRRGQVDQTDAVQKVAETGFQDQAAQISDVQNTIANRQGITQNTLDDQAQTLARLQNAFGADGSLKRGEVLENGNMVGRNLTANGMIIETLYDPRGNVLGSEMLDTSILSSGGEGMMSQQAAA